MRASSRRPDALHAGYFAVAGAGALTVVLIGELAVVRVLSVA